MVDPLLIGGAVGAAAIGAAAAYSAYTGNDASVSADVDDDGTDEAEVEFEGAQQPAVDKAVEEAKEDDDEDESAENAEAPDVVTEKDDITEVKGVGDTRADDLADEGYETAADLYYASDDNLEAVNGLGPRSVSHIRDDIGSIDDEAVEGNANDETSVADSEQSDGETDTDEGGEQTESVDTGSEKSNDEVQQ